jgi:nicotinate-nucleotide adenylyltransferase
VGPVGILGGTFNPPHLGHLALARQAHSELGLERVLLMPAHAAAHKPHAEDPGAAHRLRMCRLLVGDARGLSVCTLETDRGGPSFTVDTLRSIHASHPDAELTFIVGADTASTLGTWHEPTELLELADLAVAGRAGSTRQDVIDAVAALRPVAALPAGEPGGGPRGGQVRFLEMPVIEISSSLVRSRAAHGAPIADLVGGAVAGYIAEHGLYRSPAEAEA